MTDFFLAMETLGGYGYLRWLKTADPWRLNLWSDFFGFVALAAALGAIVHGLRLPRVIRSMLWRSIDLSMGVALSLFTLGAVYDFWGAAVAQRLLPVVIGVALVGIVLANSQPAAHYLLGVYGFLAALFGLGVYFHLAPATGAVPIMIGILISLVAAYLQLRKGLSIRLIWTFDHNGLFHLVQMVGVLFLLAGVVRWQG